MMICSLGLQLVAMVSLRQHMQWRRAGALIVAGFVGLVPGLWLLQRADATAFRVGFGAFLTAYAVYMLVRPAWGALTRTPGRLQELAVGFAGGLIGGLTAMPGAVPTIWCDLRAMPKGEQRGLLQPYIAAMQLAALAMLVAKHGVPDAMLGHLRPALVPLVAGTAVGLALFGKVDERAFRRGVLCALLLSGLGFFAYR